VTSAHFNQPTLVIRDAVPADEALLHALTVDAYAEYAARMQPAAWAELEQAVRGALQGDGGYRCLVAEVDGVVVGSVRLYPPATTNYEGLTEAVPWPELRLLAVAREARGTGVGRALVDACVQAARSSGARALGLHTSHSMRAALALYASMGFTRTPEHDFQPPGAELIQGFVLRLEDED
jgi:ribosomal protein S18 acetylase RimI-like enzyme